MTYIHTYAYLTMNADEVQLKQLNVCWNTVYRKISHYNRWEFYHQLRHSSNRVVFHAFQYLQYDSECDYLQLCATYSCRQFDSLSRLRVRVEGHFDDICAAREF